MIPKWIIPRFSLRALFVLTTAAAVLCWFLWPMTEGITESQSRAVKLGMLPDEVSLAADGPPMFIKAKNQGGEWRYRVAAPVGCEPGSWVRVSVVINSENGRTVASLGSVCELYTAKKTANRTQF